jgi:uncharacterized protein DUF6588
MRASTRFAWSLLAILGIGLLVGPGQVWAEDESLEELLQQVGLEYAESYSAPFVHTFGPNLASNLFSSASIPWHGFTFGVGLKVMSSGLNGDDQNFQRVIRNVEFADYLPGTSPYFGDTGDIILSGPTIFGDKETSGMVRFYSDGLLLLEQEGIPGLVDTEYVPMAVPEIYVGGFFGLKATLRYLPEMDLGDYGKTTFKGFGLQWSAKGLLPDLPVDLMAGFFKQQLDIGTLMETTGNSYFVAASREFALVTAYAGLALEDSEMTITYEFEELAEEIVFSVEGIQDKRAILGASMGLPGMTLNLEVSKGSIATYSAGVMFGI